MLIEPRKGITDLKPVIHGGIDEAEIGKYDLRPEDMIDFSVCCNPYPHPSSLATGLAGIDIRPYPDSSAAELRSVISGHLKIDENNILPGSGTTELIRLITQAYLNADDKVLITAPTYGEYEIASCIAGGSVQKFDWQFPSNAHTRIDELLYKLQDIQPKIIFLCNPNNPTGHYLSREEVESIIAASAGTLLIIDEAYINFVDNRWFSEYLNERENVIILRSMTKDYGIAGLRLGYAMANRAIIEILRKVCPPWNVNVFAQKAGIMLLSDNKYLSETLPQIQKSKSYMMKALENCGYEVFPSEANYFLVKTGDAAAFRRSLLRHGILVRDCASFGLPEYIRIGIRTEDECRKFIEIMQTEKVKI